MRMFRAVLLGAAVVGAMAVGGGHAAQAQQRLTPGDPFGGDNAVAIQKSDCDSKGNVGPFDLRAGESAVGKTGSSRCANVNVSEAR